MKIYIRWMGAFAGRNIATGAALKFELHRSDEAAVEILHSNKTGKYFSGVACRHTRVGVLINQKNIFRSFDNDCWSRMGKDGRLYASRCNNHSDHTEGWAHMKNAIIGLVVYGSFSELNKGDQLAVAAYVKKSGLPLYKLTQGGQFVQENI